MHHYKYGGSTASRTLQCPAWIPLSEKVPKNGAGDFADRGTLLHNCIEKLINEPDLDPADLLGEKYNSITLDQEMLDEALVPALDAYDAFAGSNDFLVEFTEANLEMEEDIGGTADILAANKDTVFIIDHKFGFNIVDPEENSQGLFYLMCAREDTAYAGLFTSERNRLVIAINQPKGDGDCMTWWETDIARLNEFTEQYYDALDAEDITKPCEGDACKYCPAMATCPIKTGAARAALMLDPSSTEAATLAESMTMVHDLEAWVKEVKKVAHEQAELGLKIKGFKLVQKRALRKWSDPEGALMKVRRAKKIKLEDATDVKLKSPPALEKLCKKIGFDFDKFDAYYDSVSTGTTLVVSSDKREEIASITAIAAAITNIND